MQIKEIFMIRCISCLSVVLLHIISMVLMLQAEALANISHTVDSFRTLLMFSTPAFIFISEFLLARSYPDRVPDGFLKKRGKVIFVPFLFIAAIDALLMTSAMGRGNLSRVCAKVSSKRIVRKLYRILHSRHLSILHSAYDVS